MTAPTLPLRIDGKPLRAPRGTPPRAPGRPEWSDYQVKVPVNCNHCVQIAYESAMAGEPFDGLRKARRKRRHVDHNLLLCNEHARLQREQDEIDYPAGQSTDRKGRSGQRYIS